MNYFLRIFSNKRCDGTTWSLDEFFRYSIYESFPSAFIPSRSAVKSVFRTNSRNELKIWMDLNGFRLVVGRILKDRLRFADTHEEIKIDATIPLVER